MYELSTKTMTVPNLPNLQSYSGAIRESNEYNENKSDTETALTY
jgi:hypothetical protein